MNGLLYFKANMLVGKTVKNSLIYINRREK